MIREMTIADYEEILDLWVNTEGMGLRSLDDSREGIATFLKRNPRTSFVALDAGKIIGAILCGNDGRRGYIYHTVVQVPYRNQGIGTQLVEAAISALQREGITRVCLNVLETNEQGKAPSLRCSEYIERMISMRTGISIGQMALLWVSSPHV